MKNIIRIFTVLALLKAFLCNGMDVNEKFITSRTRKLVTIKEYNPRVDGALVSQEEWESLWKHNTHILNELRESPDRCSESLARSSEVVALLSPALQSANHSINNPCEHQEKQKEEKKT